MCGVWVGMCACACMWRSEVIGVFLDCSDFLYFRQGILWNPELTDSASLSSHPHPWDPLYLPLKPWGLLRAFNGVLRIWGSSLHACVAILYQHWAPPQTITEYVFTGNTGRSVLLSELCLQEGPPWGSGSTADRWGTPEAWLRIQHKVSNVRGIIPCYNVTVSDLFHRLAQGP